MQKLFQWSPTSPAHISVGALVTNSEGKIRAHYFHADRVPEFIVSFMHPLRELRILMRESLEDNETLEAAIHRGLHEEFGMTGKIIRYIGSLQTLCQREVVTFQKTTLYFHVAWESDGERPQFDAESKSEMVWYSPQELRAHMKAQGAVVQNLDVDESSIIERYLALPPL
jgi:NUDIX domain